MKKAISELLLELGVPVHIQGYLFLREAILMVLDDTNLLRGGITTIMYPAIADKHNSTQIRVERAIRHAVERVFLVGDNEKLTEVFKNSVSKSTGKVTNAAFIARIADYLELEEAV